MRKKRGREAAGLSGGVARVSTMDHRGKLANAESRPQRVLQRHRLPPLPSVPHPPPSGPPLASRGLRRRPCNPSRAEPPPRPGIEIILASAGLEGVGRVYAAATVDRIVCAHAQPNSRQLRH